MRRAILAALAAGALALGTGAAFAVTTSTPKANCTAHPTVKQTTFTGNPTGGSRISMVCTVPNPPAQTVTATATVTVTASPSATPTPAPSSSATPSPTSTPTADGNVCVPGDELVKFAPSADDPNGGGSAGLEQYGQPAKYDASAEEWGIYSEYRQTMGVCSYNSWYVDATVTNHSGAIQAYPSMRRIYHDWGLGGDFSGDPHVSEFPDLTTTFASTDPATCPSCNYDTAYDVWLNGISSSGDTEMMIWTHTVGKSDPGIGNKIASGVPIDGYTWDVWYGSPDYVAFIPSDLSYIRSGSFDLREFISFLVGKGKINADPTVGQISFGVETASTNSVSRHWDFTDFSAPAPPN